MRKNRGNRWAEDDATRVRKQRRSVGALVLCVVFIFFLLLDSYRFARAVKYWWRNREIEQRYVAEVERLRQEQQRLKEEIYKLEHNPLTQERLAREMGYIKQGETVYKIVSGLGTSTSSKDDGG